MPTIWVEGASDVSFYRPLVSDIPCRLEPFYGNDNAKALIDDLKLNNNPYVVVLDGDYRILERRRSPHKRVVWLSRYSHENYFWEKDCFTELCVTIAQCGEPIATADDEFVRVTQHLHDSLVELVACDVAARRSDPAPKVLPDRMEPLQNHPSRPDLSANKVGTLLASSTASLDADVLEQAKTDVAAFIAKKRLVDVIKGHIVFGVLRVMFTATASMIKGAKVMINDDSLRLLFAERIWTSPPTAEHRRLKRKLRNEVWDCFHEIRRSKT